MNVLRTPGEHFAVLPAHLFDPPCVKVDGLPIPYVDGGAGARFREARTAARGQPPTTMRGAGHFVQEDAADELSRIMADVLGAPL